MSGTVLLLALVVSASAATLVMLIINASAPALRRLRIMGNLRRGLAEDDKDTSYSSRDKTPALTRPLVSSRNRGWLQTWIARAGYPAQWPIERVLTMKVIACLLGIVVGALLVAKDPTPLNLLVAIVLIVGGYFAPEIVLYQVATKRRDAIALELPDTIDQMSIAVEAGLGFEAAMNRVARNSKGVLSQELIRTLQEIQAGSSRKDSYTGLAARIEVPDLTRFIRGVLRAETYGLAIAGVLRTQAAELRVKRRQRAEEKAQQIPVKVVFPLIVFIMPTLLLVVLGPAGIQVMNILSR